MSQSNIVQINIGSDGLVDVSPRLVKIITKDDITQIITSGYLNKNNLLGYMISPTDILNIIYSFDEITEVGIFGIFKPIISDGVITLEQDFSEGGTHGTLTDSDFSVFYQNNGFIQDLGYVPSSIDVDIDTASLITPPSTVNTIPLFSDNNGSLKSTGLAPTNISKTKISSINFAPTTGNLVKFTDNAGTIGDSNYKLISGITSPVTINATTYIFSIPSMISTARGKVQMLSQAGTAVITTVLPDDAILEVDFSSAPGAGTSLSYVFTSSNAS